MHILLTGPIDTQILRSLTGFKLVGAPSGQGSSPVSELAAAFLARHYKVSIVALDSTIETPQTYVEGGLTVVFCPFRGEPKYRARTRAKDLFRQEISYLRSAIVEQQPDIVNAHWSYEYAEAAIRSQLPHVVTVHDLGWDYLFILKDFYRLVRLFMKLRVMIRAKRAVVVSPFMQKKLWQYGFFGESHIIPNGVVAAKLFDRPDDLLEGAIKFASIGNPGKIKNVEASVNAFRVIRDSIPTAELHLFGPGLDKTYVEGMTNVFGHGHVAQHELMHFLQNEAAVLIHPSRIETFGMIIAEAKVRGVPVVGGIEAGAVPYVCGSDAGCLLVDIEDSSAIADAVLYIVSKKDRYNAFSSKAREDIVKRFDRDDMAEMYLALYRTVIH